MTFLAARCVSVPNCLLLLLQINHVNNSNSSDSGQSLFSTSQRNSNSHNKENTGCADDGLRAERCPAVSVHYHYK